MPAPRHLRAAPILEAIIDFRVKARPGLEQRDFESLKGELSARFPHVNEQRGGTVTFQLTPTGVQPSTMEQGGFQGFIFRSSDEKLLAQFRIDGFTLNQRKPYTSWGELRPIALDLWRQYCSVARPEGVTRLALRFINQLVLPSEAVEIDFDRCITMAPVIPPELPQIVSAFVTRTTIHDRDKGLAAHVAQAFSSDSEQRMNYVLDIDAFREGAWSPSDPGIETTLDALREMKNLIFFSSLTETTLRQFE